MTTSLLAISPIDGRYQNKTSSLNYYFSEYAYTFYRLKVEVEYLDSFLDLIDKNSDIIKDVLKDIITNFNVEECLEIKQIEKEINHDVKAIEYYIRKKFMEVGLSDNLNHYIHYGLTSQDINSTALVLMLKEFSLDFLIPTISTIANLLKEKISEYRFVTMIGLTHGQPATITRMGKFFELYRYKLCIQLKKLK